MVPIVFLHAHQSTSFSPVRPRVALHKEPFLEVSCLGLALLLRIGSMRVVKAHGSILAGRQAVLTVACSRVGAVICELPPDAFLLVFQVHHTSILC